MCMVLEKKETHQTHTFRSRKMKENMKRSESLCRSVNAQLVSSIMKGMQNDVCNYENGK